MKRLAWASLTFTTAAVVVASCVPDFKFREQSGAGGGTAGGGAIGGAGGQATAGATGGEGGAGGAVGMGGAGGSGGSVLPIVPCGSPSVLCNPGEHCCYHANDPDCDLCSDTDCVGTAACVAAGNYAVLECDAPADCGDMTLCCMSYFQSMSLVILTGSECRAACMVGSQLQLCDGDTDCPGQQTCTYDLYPGYKACEQMQ